MEQALDLSYLLEICPNEIVHNLDGNALSSITQVSHLFQESCNAVPTKYLTIPFSDVADYGGVQFINRFITQPDSWLLKSEIDEVFAFFIQDKDNYVSESAIQRISGGAK